MQISQEEVAQLRAMGNSDEDISQAIAELEQEESMGINPQLQQTYNAAMQAQQNDPRTMSNPSMFRVDYGQNMIEKQLEVNDILEKIEHILRGDKLKFRKGMMIWTPCVDNKERDMNDEGVDQIMKTLSLYINKNTLLSNYDEETIRYKVLDLGERMADLIFMKYHEFGMASLEKRKKYEIIVFEIVDAVHSAYLRALGGGERESLRETRQVSQMENLSPMQGGMGGVPLIQKRSVFNPMRYFGGKFK